MRERRQEQSARRAAVPLKSPGAHTAQAARDNYPGALAAYDRAIQISLAYPEALNNRGGTLVKLGRLEDAKASYRECLRFDPNYAGAAASLRALEAGILFVPQKPVL